VLEPINITVLTLAAGVGLVLPRRELSGPARTDKGMGSFRATALFVALKLPILEAIRKPSNSRC